MKMELLFLSFLLLITLQSSHSIDLNSSPASSPQVSYPLAGNGISASPFGSPSDSSSDSPSESPYPSSAISFSQSDSPSLAPESSVSPPESSPSSSSSSSSSSSESSDFSQLSSLSLDSFSSDDDDEAVSSGGGQSASLLSVQDAAGADPDVQKICDATDHPALCIATVAPLLHGKVDVPAVLEVAIKASDQLAKTGYSMAKKAAEMPGTPAKIATILKSCADSFDTVLYNFDKAKTALRARDIGTMNTMLSAVITDVGDCEDAFEGLTSPLSSYTDKLTSMASNCLAIVSELQT